MTTPVPHRTMSTVLTLGVPLAFAAALLVVARAWSADLPDPVAVHFTAAGPDGFSSLAAAVWPAAVAIPALSLAFWAMAFFAGRTAQVRRVAAGAAVGLASFVTALVVGTLDLQRGLDDAADVEGVGLALGVAFVIGIACAALGAWLAPADAPQPTTAPLPPDAAMLDLGSGEAAVWVTHAESRAALVVGGSVTVLTAALGLLLSAPFVLVPVLLVAAAVLSSTWFTVTVDRRGLTVRSALGWPRFAVPADEVERAHVVSVSPVPEFGGWGYRVGRGGRVGVVLRSGEGLQVERTGGRSFVVTVDDAATGAALLNTLAARTRTP